MPRRFHFFLLHSAHNHTHPHHVSTYCLGWLVVLGWPAAIDIDCSRGLEDVFAKSAGGMDGSMDGLRCGFGHTFDKDPSDQNGWRCGWWCQAYLLAHGVRPEHTKPRMKAQLREVIRRLTQPQSATANHIAASPALSRTGISLSLSLSLSLSINIFIDHVWCLR
jgi:hypothetical protein